MVVKIFLICSKCTISRWKVAGKLAVCSKFPQTVWNTCSRPSWLYILISYFMDNCFHFYKVDAKSNCFLKVSHVVDIFNTGDIEPREFVLLCNISSIHLYIRTYLLSQWCYIYLFSGCQFFCLRQTVSRL